jgi:hypothetical protein
MLLINLPCRMANSLRIYHSRSLIFVGKLMFVVVCTCCGYQMQIMDFRIVFVIYEGNILPVSISKQNTETSYLCSVNSKCVCFRINEQTRLKQKVLQITSSANFEEQIKGEF